MPMKFLLNELVSHRSKSKEYREEINYLKGSGKTDELNRWLDKLEANEKFIKTLVTIRDEMKKRYIERTRIPSWLKKK